MDIPILKIFLFSLIIPNQIYANVIGIDKRKILNPKTDKMANFIGRFDSGCTGVLLTENLVLTNLHCLIEEVLSDNDPLVFHNMLGEFITRPKGSDIEQKSTPVFTWYLEDARNPRSNPDQDWAIVLLHEPLKGSSDSSEQSFLDIPKIEYTEGLAKISNFNFPRPRVMLAGYSFDLGKTKSPSLDPYCTIEHMIEPNSTSESGRYAYLHDCQFNKGASGGPLFELKNGRYQILALQQGQYIPDDDDKLSEPIFPGDDSQLKPNVGIAIPIALVAEAIDAVKEFVSSVDLESKKKAKSLIGNLKLKSRNIMHSPDNF